MPHASPGRPVRSVRRPLRMLPYRATLRAPAITTSHYARSLTKKRLLLAHAPTPARNHSSPASEIRDGAKGTPRRAFPTTWSCRERPPWRSPLSLLETVLHGHADRQFQIG